MATKKIAVPTDDQVEITDHVGKCRYLAVYTISEEQIVGREIIENKFTYYALQQGLEGCDDAGHEPGMGDHSHAALIEAIKDCDLLISRGFGRRLKEDFARAGINAYITDEPGTMDEIIAKYVDGDLTVVNTPGCGCDHEES